MGRDVTVRPDHDAAGARYAADVVGLVPGAKVVPVPASFPNGWDLGDDLPTGVSLVALLGLLQLAETTKVTKAKKQKKSKPDLKQSVEEAKRERDGMLRKIKALLSTEGRTEEEAEAYQAKAKELAKEYLDKYGSTEEELKSAMADVAEEADEIGANIDGDALLNSVHAFLLRFVSYPSQHASVAHALWIAHTHRMNDWDSTPRIAFLSPERGSGKTRALEVMEFLVPRPVHSINNSVAYVIRKIADDLVDPSRSYRTSSITFSQVELLTRPTFLEFIMPATGRAPRLGAALLETAPLGRKNCPPIAL